MNAQTIVPLTLFNGNDTDDAATHQTCQFQLVKGSAKILEMEDALFHHNSAVMMPDNPRAQPGEGDATSEQKKVSGIRALALAFREYQLYPNQKLLLAGHADRSGDPKYNFELSGLRARNVLYLLQGKRSEWADVSYQRQKIEDYQEILVYFAKETGWLCDPGAVNNQWNEKTEKAVANFLTMYNLSFAYKPLGAQVDEGILDAVKRSSDKKWPREMWEAVFDLYENDLILATTGKHLADDAFLQLRASLAFVDPAKPFVACGESFPISQDTRGNYRSQQDRRVEILFFDEDETPVLCCPARVSSVHAEAECPIYNKLFYQFKYISPESFFTALYHLRFTYYSRIHQEIRQVPQGLTIRAWREGTTELQASSTYDSVNGVYEITVKGITNSPREQAIHFSFETANLWLFAQDQQTAAKLKTLTREQFDALSTSDKMCHYDLPEKWDARNWQCSLDGANGGFAEMNKEVTTAQKPMAFCLDDCVVADANAVPVRWTAGTRITAFDLKMDIVNPDPNRPFWAAGARDTNYLRSDPAGLPARVVAVNGIFHDVSTRRCTTGAAIGARAAVMDDASCHAWERRRGPVVNVAGHFDLHYFAGCLDSTGKDCSVVLVHWSCHFVKGVGRVEDADMENFRKTGLDGAKQRWEKKGYLFKPKSDPSCVNLTIVPRFLFEENKAIARPHCTVKIHDPKDPNFRSDMGLDEANFGKDTYQEDASRGGATEDNVTFNWFTMSHELGHASGLHDEYLEPIKGDKEFVWTPVLPAFSQWYACMPYSCDSNSIMRQNRIPHMRHFWYFCRWANENTHVRQLTKQTIFQVVHAGQQNNLPKSFVYTRPDADTDFYKPTYWEDNAVNGSAGKFDLYLFRLGNDELTDGDYTVLVPSEAGFDGILVLRINVRWLFRNHTGTGDSQWKTNLKPPVGTGKVHEKLQYLRDFQNMIDMFSNQRFRLECPSSTSFRKIYLYVLPHYHLENAAGDVSKRHFTVTVRADHPTTQAAYADTYTGNSFTVGTWANAMTILRYMLGLPTTVRRTDETGAAVEETATDIIASDLEFLATWVRSKTNTADAYSVTE